MTNSAPAGEHARIHDLRDDNSIYEADSVKLEANQEDNSISLAPLTASIVDYEYENGRRYHAYKAGRYPLPNDENELDRLDLQHHVMTLLLNGEYHLAPLGKPTQILDLGTGTGLWAIEMADRFPSATVIGVDLSPVQPTSVPKNVSFEVDDIESDWPHPENHFDHIHCRTMIGSIGDWKKMIRQSFKHCKPGGYLEIQELDPRLASDDGSVARSPFHDELLRSTVEASTKYGKETPHPSDFKVWLEEAGFVDVKDYLYKIPINSWPKNSRLKEIGKWQCFNYTEGYEAISMGLLTRVLGWTPTEFSVFMAKVRKELVDKSIHTYQYFVVAVGRKPHPQEIAAAKYASTELEADTSVGTELEQPYISSIEESLPKHATQLDSCSVLLGCKDDNTDSDDDQGFGWPYSPEDLDRIVSRPRRKAPPPAGFMFSGRGSEKNQYFVADASGKPNEFPQRPRPRNGF